MIKRAVKRCFVLVLSGVLPLMAGAYDGNNNSYQTNNNGYSSYSRDAFRESRSQSNPYGFSAQSQYQSGPYSRQSSIANDVITVMTSQVGAHVKLGGSVISYKEVTLTAQLPGRVQYISGEAGDHFKINSVLVALDDDDLLAKRRAAVAQLSNMAAGYRNSRVQYTKNVWNPGQKYQKYFTPPPPATTGGGGGYFPQMFDRFFGLGGTGGGANNYYYNYFSNPWLYGNPWVERQADLYSSVTGVSQAGSQVMAVQAQIDEIDARLLDTRSIAPFDGVILRKMVEVGDTVQPGTPLLNYADTTDLQIQVEVPARLMPGLQTGMIVPATLDVGDKEVNARISQIYPLADPQRHTVTVKLDLPKGVPGGPGMYAEVTFPDVSVPESNLPVIPISAIIWRGSLPAVYIVNGDNDTELRLIRLGEQLDNNTVAVLSGIRAGERLYSNPPPGMNSNWSKRPAQKN